MTIEKATCRKCGKLLHSYGAKEVCPSCLWTSLFSTQSTEPSKPFLFKIPNHIIVEEIARGGMGIVYRARELNPAREIALKMLLPIQGSSEAMRERFRQEIRAAATLDHPNILPIYRTGEWDGLPFFTMKLAVRGTLAERLPEYQGNYDRIARLMESIARAIVAAHERGILHRDLKPGNILFDEADQPFVADFGLAKLSQEVADEALDITRTMALLGTPHYMPPETLHDGMSEASVRGDIYALGAILYFLLAGQPPFTGKTLSQLLSSIANDDVPPLRHTAPATPRDLETICRKCLEKDPARRYASASALADDLRRFYEGKPTSARPVTAMERLWLWTRRNPTASTMGIIILTLAFSLSLGFLQFLKLRQDQRRDQAAMTIIDEKITNDPYDAAARIEQGLVLEKAGRWQEAVDAFSEAVQITSAPPLLWDFNETGNNRDWNVIVNIENPTLGHGILRFTPLKIDASLELLTEPFEGRRYPWLHVRLRNAPPIRESALHWITDDSKEYNNLKHAILYLVPEDTEMRIYSVDLSAFPDWTTKRIVGLRFNSVGTIPPGVTLSGQIEVDWICLNESATVPVTSLLEWKRYVDSPRRRQSLLHRSRILERLEHRQEAEQDYCLAHGITPRQIGLPSNLIDLTRFYNASLMDSFHDENIYTGSELNNFPSGVHDYGGSFFDARGIIQLSGLHLPPRFPKEVSRIPIGQKFHKLSVLLGTGWMEEPDREIAAFTLHYADGRKERLPVAYGVHVEDWALHSDGGTNALPKATVAWIGTNEYADSRNQRIRLYKSAWMNPRPNVVVQMIDFSSNVTACAPFLLAMTVAP